METIVPEGYQETKLGIIPNDWEVKTFQSIFERVTRKNIVNNQNVLTISAQHGLVNQEDFFNKSVSSEDLSGYILLNKGEFAYNKSYSNGYPMGAIKRLKKYDQGVVSSLYIYFKAIKDEPEFYEHYFEAGMLNREIYKIAQEGARNHGLLNMSVIEFFKDLHVAKPPKIEQQKIAQILTTWDAAITKQEELIKEKEQLKKGLMQKLLSGEVRFGGFNDKWQEIKLKDILTEHGTKSDGKCEVHSVSVSKGLINQIEHLGRSYAAEDTSNYNLVKPFDIVYTKSPTGDFPFGIIKQNMNNFNAIVSPLYGVFTATNKYMGHFLHLYFESPIRTKNYLLPIIQKGAKNTINITNKTFLSKSILIPMDEREQEKISNFFLVLNANLDLLKKELEELKLQKKALMQKLLTGQVRVKV